MTAYGLDQMTIVPASITGIIKALVTKPVTRSSLLEAMGRALDKTFVDQDSALRQQHKHEPLARDMRHLNGARILLVEDNEMNQELATELLQSAGITLVTAKHGQEALDILSHDAAFDAILMDCQMPVMDGYQATQAIRKQSALDAIPVIAMTADVMEGDREKTARAGMVDLIAKPIHVEQMFATLARWITPQSAMDSGTASLLKPAQDDPIPLPEVAGLDTAQGLATVMGQRPLYLRQLKRFFDSYQDFATLFAAALVDTDTQAATRAAHTLRGIAGNLGATDLQHAAARLEQACKASAPADQINTELAQTLNKLHNLLAGLKDLLASSSPRLPDLGNADPARLLALMQTLAVQLANGDADASETMTELHNLTAAGPLSAELAQVARLIDQFDFEAAELALETVLDKLPPVANQR
ncbi:MAG: PAS domain-containing protein [Comamonadaceae bacterium]|nr:MAG: PAS domain-containing protein [Comamonadaceae bacterium]